MLHVCLGLKISSNIKKRKYAFLVRSNLFRSYTEKWTEDQSQDLKGNISWNIKGKEQKGISSGFFDNLSCHFAILEMRHVNIALCPVSVMSCVRSRPSWRDFQEEGASLLDSHVFFSPGLCISWHLTGLQASGAHPLRSFRDTLHISARSTSNLAGANLNGAPVIDFPENFTSAQRVTSQEVSEAPQWQLSRSPYSAWTRNFLISFDWLPQWVVYCSLTPVCETSANFCAIHCAIAKPTLMSSKSQP